MVVQKFVVQHNENQHTIEYDTDDGIEVLRYQLYSLTLVPPENQKAEEDALFFQQQYASQGKDEFERRLRPYVDQVLLYEDPVRQEAARKSVPVDELEEKAIVALAKVEISPA